MEELGKLLKFALRLQSLVMPHGLTRDMGMQA